MYYIEKMSSEIKPELYQKLLDALVKPSAPKSFEIYGSIEFWKKVDEAILKSLKENNKINDK